MKCQRSKCGLEAIGFHISRDGIRYNFCNEHFKEPDLEGKWDTKAQILEELKILDDNFKRAREDVFMDIEEEFKKD